MSRHNDLNEDRAFWKQAKSWRESPIIPTAVVREFWTKAGTPVCPSCAEEVHDVGEFCHFDLTRNWQFVGIPDVFFCICGGCCAKLRYEQQDTFIADVMLRIILAVAADREQTIGH
jgi:hypothetical protein